jgi:hypothetical protein
MSEGVLVINDMPFFKVPGAKYKFPPERIIQILNTYHLEKPMEERQISLWRTLIATDLWFVVYFVLKIPIANHPFIVNACREVERGPSTNTLDLWAREHFKSTILTIAEPIQRIVRNPEERIGIFSYSQRIAGQFLRQLKTIFETSQFLKDTYRDVFYQDPERESPSWSEEGGLIVRRQSVPKEASFEAWSILQGMPTSKHFTGRIYDDIMTKDYADSPEVSETLKQNFASSQNLGVDGGWHRVLGTPYRYDDIYSHIEELKLPNGEPAYHTRKKPATHDGTPSGRPVFISESRNAFLQTNPVDYAAQQLIDPSPQQWQKLDERCLQDALPMEIPKQLWKFMLVDPAGDGEKTVRKGDSWAMAVVGIEPFRDDVGLSNIYILDMVLRRMTETDAYREVVSMYARNGWILKLGVEKVALSTTEVHVSNALRSKGRIVTIDNGGIELLRPAGRSKVSRISNHLAWPLNNGKIHISTAVSKDVRDRLRREMKQFPNWHDDGIDLLAYVYDLAKNYRFGIRPPIEVENRDAYEREQEAQERRNKWMRA